MQTRQEEELKAAKLHNICFPGTDFLVVGLILGGLDEIVIVEADQVVTGPQQPNGFCTAQLCTAPLHHILIESLASMSRGRGAR